MNSILKAEKFPIKNHGNFGLLLMAVLLSGIGLFSIYDLTSADYADIYSYATRQVAGGMGLTGALLAYKIDYYWKNFGILYVFLLFLTFLVFGVKMEMLPETIKLTEGYLCRRI